ncbi:MAG: hypothetical protein KME35_19110 [Aphanocapsa sp. GSE-SYN-MK-11-07L]|nr:hypothetical protein [Aphanocapsa sp. GSE-SYN-MK-11-07L]
MPPLISAIAEDSLGSHRDAGAVVFWRGSQYLRRSAQKNSSLRFVEGWARMIRARITMSG